MIRSKNYVKHCRQISVLLIPYKICATIDLQIPVLTSVLKTLKLVRSKEAVEFFEKTPATEW